MSQGPQAPRPGGQVLRNNLLAVGLLTLVWFLVLGPADWRASADSLLRNEGHRPAVVTATSEKEFDTSPVPLAVAANSETQKPDPSNDYFSIGPDEPPLPAGPGLSITPTYSPAGLFQGYLVAGRSPDSRFDHGDVITAIDGHKVEDSAAGSELLLIALTQTDRQLSTMVLP